ncbi:hypothetical protein TNCT_435141 [Trichonephila clavata]|uniref:Uncharacterized protein n=1 Tax=Trichonephila clavata TaxID=2740835 RepID=A0A8X6IPL6_TRICU|nr:hypothetical protein TNCT_435141 [Trichonephila clavata]
MRLRSNQGGSVMVSQDGHRATHLRKRGNRKRKPQQSRVEEKREYPIPSTNSSIISYKKANYINTGKRMALSSKTSLRRAPERVNLIKKAPSSFLQSERVTKRRVPERMNLKSGLQHLL